MIYLASPYSHSSAAVRDRRYKQALAATQILTGRGHVVISPIVHSHHVCMADPSLDTTYEQWRDLDETLIVASAEVWVLMLDGWRESVGIQAELELAGELARPVKWVTWPGLEVR